VYGIRGEIRDLGSRIKSIIDKVVSCDGPLRMYVLFGVAATKKAARGHRLTEIVLEDRCMNV
jgi:hypothetical protein